MVFEPAERSEILAEILGETKTLSKLSDVRKGGVVYRISGASATQHAKGQRKLHKIYKAFGLDCKGVYLDDRVSQFPGFKPRLGPAAASGSFLYFRRQSSVGALVVPAGVIVAKKTNPSDKYITTEQFVFADGQLSYPGSGQAPVAMTSIVQGTRGNAAVGEVRIVVSSPIPELLTVNNLSEVTGGIDREGDLQLRKRAFDFLGSLARTTPAALAYVIGSITAPDGSRARSDCIQIYEDPNERGITYAIVDNGDGFSGSEVPGPVTSFIVPPSGGSRFWFQRPVASKYPTVKIEDGADVYTYPPESNSTYWTLVGERGVAECRRGKKLPPGSTWTVYDYTIFKPDSFPAYAQEVIEGLVSGIDPSTNPGWRASGCRVIICVPFLQTISLNMFLVAEGGPGNTIPEVRQRVTAAAVEFFKARKAGTPLVKNALIAVLMTVKGVVNLKIADPADDVDSASFQHKIYLTPFGVSYDF